MREAVERERIEWQRTSRFNAGQVREARAQCDVLRQRLQREREERARAASGSPLRARLPEPPLPLIGEDCPPLMRSASPPRSVDLYVDSIDKCGTTSVVHAQSSLVRSPDQFESEHLSKSKECDELRLALARSQNETQEMYVMLEGIRERVERLTSENSALRLSARLDTSEVTENPSSIRFVVDRPNVAQESTSMEDYEQLEELRSINADLMESLSVKEDMLSDLELSLKMKEDKIKEIEELLSHESATVDELREVSDDLRLKLTERGQELQIQRVVAADSQAVVEKLICQVNAKDQELLQLKKAHEDLRVNFDHLTSHLREKVEEHKLRNDSAQSAHMVNDELMEQLRGRENELHELRELAEQLQRANIERIDQLRGLEMQVHEKGVALEDMQRSHDDLREQLNVKENKLRGQSESAEALRSMNEELKALLEGKELMLVEQMDSLDELQTTNRTLLSQCKMFEELHRLSRNTSFEGSAHSAGSI